MKDANIYPFISFFRQTFTSGRHPGLTEARVMRHLQRLPQNEFEELYRTLVCNAPQQGSAVTRFCTHFPSLPVNRYSPLLRQAARARHVTALQTARRKLQPRLLLAVATVLIVNIHTSDITQPLLTTFF